MELWTALFMGQYDLAHELIRCGANVNEPISTEADPKTTFLHYAVFRKSNVQCIRVLGKLGANFNALDSKKCTPLHWAALYHAHPDVVELLIDGGAIVDAWDVMQRTPLHLAVEQKLNESAKRLIGRGASIEAVDWLGCSILHVAAKNCNVEMIKILISHRVNIDPRDIHGQTPLIAHVSKLEDGATEIVSI